MTDVGGGSLVQVAIQEPDHIVAAGGLEHIDVALSAGSVLQPVAVGGGEAGSGQLSGAEGVGTVLLDIDVSQFGEVAAGLHVGHQLLSVGLGGLHSGGLLLLGGLHGVAILVGGGGGGAGQEGDLIGEGVDGILVLIVVGGVVLVGVGQSVPVGFLILGEHDGSLQAALIDAGGHVSAVNRPQVGGVGVAGGDGGVLHIGNGGVIGLSAALRQLQGEAVLLGGVGEGGHLGQGVEGGLHEVVVVGLSLLLVHILVLGVQAGVEVGQAGEPHGGILVVLIFLLIGAVVIVGNLTGGEVVAVDGNCGGAVLEEVGVPDKQRGDQDDHHHANHPVQNGFALGGLRLPGLLELFLSQVLAGALALLFFSGCAHECLSPLVVIGRRGELCPSALTHHCIIQENEISCKCKMLLGGDSGGFRRVVSEHEIFKMRLF